MNHQENPGSGSNSGLLRFRSAPSSLFSNFPIGNDTRRDLVKNWGITHFDPRNFIEEFEEQKPNLNGFSSNSCLPPEYPKQSSSSMAGSNLMRQSSSPAGLFSNITSQDGYGALSPSSSRLRRSPLSFSSLGILPQIPETGSGSIDGNFNESAKLGNRYPVGSWNGSPHFPDNFTLFRKELENDGKPFCSSPNGEIGIRTNFLSHHLSLPKTSAEIGLLFQDTVPCKVRAKRGCATHPRSIAERVRRTRISERMRKLQELVPNMEKQTNTAEMLDLAVEHIKDLQKQYKILSENRAKCKCLSTQKIQNL